MAEGARLASSKDWALFDAVEDRPARPVRPGLVLGYGAIPTDHIEEGLHKVRDCFRR